MNSDEANTQQVNLHTWSLQYDKPPTILMSVSQTKVSNEPLSSPNGTLQIHLPKVKVPSNIPKGPLHQNVASSKSAHTYNIVEDLA